MMKKKIFNIFFTVILIALIAFWLIAAYAIFNWIENDDDWAHYTEKKFDTSYDISSDIFNLSQLKAETTNIAQNYEKSVKLTKAEYYLEDDTNGLITLEFYRDFPPNNKACTIEMKLDIATKKVYNIRYRKGHGKTINGHENEIIDTLNTDILSYLNNDGQRVSVLILNYGVYSHSISANEIEKMR